MKLYILLITLLIAELSLAQIPTGYYDDADGLSGQALRSALHNIISNHNEQTYASIWISFQSTDKKADGTVWDMYSDIPGGTPAYTFTFVSDQCGNYSSEGDCYNREHSFPKSWFNDASPMITDLFHIYPTDGYVNGKRGNYPYGDVGNASWTSTNGSKLGNCSFPGYTSTVFEPIDEYKGDFARTYFYMMTCYMDLVSGWSSPMLTGNDLADWSANLLVQWDIQDPVSQKEIDRNNAIYNIQQNRNPFIDHPEWVEEIWGNPDGLPDMQALYLNLWYSRHQLHLKSGQSISGKLMITNLMGQSIKSIEVNSKELNISLNLPSGIYLATFQSSKQCASRKLIVND